METMTPEQSAPEGEPQRAPERGPLRAALKTARPHEWVKNVLVFAGLLFSGQVDDPWAIGQAVITFVAFCAISSAGYFVNDLNDVELDRAHPKKRFRPIAAGQLSIGSAWATPKPVSPIKLDISKRLKTLIFN